MLPGRRVSLAIQSGFAVDTVAVRVTFVLMIMAGTGIAYDVMFALFMATFVAIAGKVWRDPSPILGQR